MTTTRSTSLRVLVGSGHRIGLFALPVLVAGLLIQFFLPDALAVGELSTAWTVAAWVCLAVGVTGWLWSVALILTRIPRGELITTGPYRVVRHPLYVSVSLLVLPAAGVLLGSWLGALVGIALYCGSRIFAPEEETRLAERFGLEWDRYRHSVWLPQL
jgi:protein-S-isoprenylcysteine O-methyltransferase Ste14